jgi:histidine ammonia-lyase
MPEVTSVGSGIGAILLTGHDLTPAEVATVARCAHPVAFGDDVPGRVDASHRTAHEATGQRAVYGRSTGVGANRTVAVPPMDAEHGQRLLRSHAGGAGPRLDATTARALLVVRANQLARGGSGVAVAAVEGVLAALNLGLTPPIRAWGGIGTGDLPALATLALCLTGERDWVGGTMPPVPIERDDALAFVSSNALSSAEAALAVHDLLELAAASTVITALSFRAVDASTEPLAAEVHLARPHQGQVEVAASLRSLLAGAPDREVARVQDPFGFRAVPQVHGAAMTALRRLHEVVRVELNAGGENPLVSTPDIAHNGNFVVTELGLSLDSARASLAGTSALSVARLATMMDPAYTGGTPFAAAGPAGSSGLMVLEFIAQAALSQVRHLALPVALHSAVISGGAEDYAGFAAHGAQLAREIRSAWEVVLGCELVATVRVLRQSGRVPVTGPAAQLFALVDPVLPSEEEDRPVDTDVDLAISLLPGLAALCR